MALFQAIFIVTQSNVASELQLKPFTAHGDDDAKIRSTDLKPFLGVADGPASFVLTREDRSRCYVGTYTSCQFASGGGLFTVAVLSLNVCPLAVTRAAQWIAESTCAETATRRMKCILFDVPRPMPGYATKLVDREEISCTEVLTVYCQPLNEFPSNNLDLASCINLLFQTLTVATVTNVVRCLLLERSVIMHVDKRNISILPILGEALMSLLFPVKWQNTYIPCLPVDIDLSMMIEAPFPFLLGVETGVLQSVPSAAMESIVVVNLNTSTVTVPGDTIVQQPQKTSFFGMASPTVTKKSTIKSTIVPAFPPKLQSQLQSSAAMYLKGVHAPSVALSACAMPSSMPAWIDSCDSMTLPEETLSTFDADKGICSVLGGGSEAPSPVQLPPMSPSSAIVRALGSKDVVPSRWSLVHGTLHRVACHGVLKSFVDMMIQLIGDYDNYFRDAAASAHISPADLRDDEGSLQQQTAYLGISFDAGGALTAKRDLQPFINGLFDTQGFQEFLSQRLLFQSISDPECLFFDALADEKLLGNRNAFIQDESLRATSYLTTLLVCFDARIGEGEPCYAPWSYSQAYEVATAKPSRQAYASPLRTGVSTNALSPALSPGLNLGEQVHKSIRTKRLSVLPALSPPPRKSIHPREQEWMSKLIKQPSTSRLSSAAATAVSVDEGTRRFAATPHAGSKRCRFAADMTPSVAANTRLQQSSVVTPAHAASVLQTGSMRKRRRLLVDAMNPGTATALEAEMSDCISPRLVPHMSMNDFIGSNPAPPAAAEAQHSSPEVAGADSEDIQPSIGGIDKIEDEVDVEQAAGDEYLMAPEVTYTDGAISCGMPGDCAARKSFCPQDILSTIPAAIQEVSDLRSQLTEMQHRLRAAELDRMKYAMQVQQLMSRMRVCIRVRAFSSKQEGALQVTSDSSLVCLKEGGELSLYEFDKVWAPNATQKDVYHELEPMISRAVEAGENAIVMAYGQTGSGKTYTMNCGKYDLPLPPDLLAKGASLPTCHNSLPLECGVYARSILTVFAQLEALGCCIEAAAAPGLLTANTATVRISVIEIYNETIVDLLQPFLSHAKACDCGGCDGKGKLVDKVNVRVLGAAGAPGSDVKFQGMCAPRVANAWHALKLLASGLSDRSTANNGINQRSSRSHALVIVQVTRASQSNLVVNGNAQSIISNTACKLIFADLAGSEKLPVDGRMDTSNAKSTGLAAASSASNWSKWLNPVGLLGGADNSARIKESCAINGSLTTLGMVIATLSTDDGAKAKHVPYRDSVLTLALSDCIGGSAHAALLCTISGLDSERAETASTVQFAARARNIKIKALSSKTTSTSTAVSKAIVNGPSEERRSATLLKEIERLKADNARLNAELAAIKENIAVSSEEMAPPAKSQQLRSAQRLAAPRQILQMATPSSKGAEGAATHYSTTNPRLNARKSIAAGAAGALSTKRGRVAGVPPSPQLFR
jgi:hypothetical protein